MSDFFSWLEYKSGKTLLAVTLHFCANRRAYFLEDKIISRIKHTDANS